MDEAPIAAGLLDRFNREYDTPTPGVAVLAAACACTARIVSSRW